MKKEEKKIDSVEQLEFLFPDYIDESIIKTPPYRIARVEMTSGRHYFVRKTDEDSETGEYILPSITTIIDKTSPLSREIINKMIEFGKEKWDAYLKERQDYGTNMHILISEFIRSKKLSLPLKEDDIVSISSRNKGFNVHIYEKFKSDLISDLLAFAQFVVDYEVTPMAVEIPLASTYYKFAGTLDFPCFMTINEKGYHGELYKTGPNKGAMKETYKDVRVIGLVDFKSGRHGFYRGNEIQLFMAELLFIENFPEISLSGYKIKSFNWSPKEWRVRPTYNLTEQTGKTTIANVKSRVELFLDEYDSNFKSKRYFEGDLILGEAPEEIIKTKFSYE